MVETNNEKKRFGRRALLGFVSLALIEVNFYFSVYKHLDLAWFTKHTEVVLYLLGFIIGGLTLTDIVKEWKAK